MEKITGYSRAQVSRLIGDYKQMGQLKKGGYKRHRFPRKYRPWEVKLLAKTDELHGWLSGPAIKKIMQREHEIYGHTEFEKVSQISVSHLYNLRRSNIYRDVSRRFTKTKPAISKIGERTKPDPGGQPGYIRIDTVHQGDINGHKACAELLNEYHKDFLNPYVNFHRPCFFPVTVIDHKGKIKKTYPHKEVKTPYEKLKSLPQAECCLRCDVTFDTLETIANETSDNEFAERMGKACDNLFQQISRFVNRTA